MADEPKYTLTVNRHDGPHNYVRIRQSDSRTLIALTDQGIEVAEDLSPEESRMVIRVLAEHCRSLYMLQEGR